MNGPLPPGFTEIVGIKGTTHDDVDDVVMFPEGTLLTTIGLLSAIV